MSVEDNHRPSDLSADRQEKELSEASQTNPFMWQGEEFKVVVKEEERTGEKHLVFGMMDSNKEVVVIDFTQAGKFSTTFLGVEEMELFEMEATPGSPVLPSSIEQEATHPSTPQPPTLEGGAPGSPALPPETDQARPEKQAPTKIMGNIREIGELGKTKKQEKPMLFFTVWDSENKVERRMIAFESVAEQLASPDTNLQQYEDITLYAHKHVNTIHVHGKEKEMEDWYVQAAVYQDKRYEKPRNKRKKE